MVLKALAGCGRLLLEGQDACRVVLAEVGSQLLLVLELQAVMIRKVRGLVFGLATGDVPSPAGELSGRQLAALIAGPLPAHSLCIAGCLSKASRVAHLGWRHGINVLHVLGLARHVVVGHVEVAGAPVGNEAVHLRQGRVGLFGHAIVWGQRLAGRRLQLRPVPHLSSILRVRRKVQGHLLLARDEAGRRGNKGSGTHVVCCVVWLLTVCAGSDLLQTRLREKAVADSPLGFCSWLTQHAQHAAVAGCLDQRGALSSPSSVPHNAMPAALNSYSLSVLMSATAAASLRERVVRVGSAGKIFSLTGWKVGWLTGPRELISHEHRHRTVAAPQCAAASQLRPYPTDTSSGTSSG